MRPLGDGDTADTAAKKARSREEIRSTPGNEVRNSQPTTFFLATESMMSIPPSGDHPLAADSSYGVQSLEESQEVSSLAISDGEGKAPEQRSKKRRSTVKALTVDESDASTEGLDKLDQRLQSHPPRWEVPNHLQEPFHRHSTPASLGSSSVDPSLPGSPKSMPSFRHSDEDIVSNTSSQGLIYSGDDEAQSREEPQDSLDLIMPSIMLPTRRPFTDRGKALGQLKILVAGARGIGKTSLIKSIVQSCNDIVHVDVPSTRLSVPELQQPRKPRASARERYTSTTSISEIYASTKPYPSWWSDVEEAVPRRRRSSGELVLERNICFIDTPGHTENGITNSDSVRLVKQYCEARASQMAHLSNLPEAEVLGLLGGNGGGHVDVVLYLVDQNLESADIEYIRYFDSMTNVVLLISKSDLISGQELQNLKDDILQSLRSADLITSDICRNSSNSSILAICSSPSSDDENMDASLLMSSNYIQPLQASELHLVVERIFSSDCASWLKHSAARKVIRWLRTSKAPAAVPSALRVGLPQSPTLASPSPRSLSSSSWDDSFALIPRSPGQLSYLQARTADNCQREERVAQIHLANWASNLQKSLRNERLQYETLARGEQTRWLQQRFEERALDLVDIRVPQETASSSPKANSRASSRRQQSRLGHGLVFASDPLGLMRMNDTFWKHSWTTLQALGAVGLLGAAALWVIRGWTWTYNGDHL